ncbi:MAG: TssA family type VI secretion system protein [Sulfurovum sp.]|nr:TssA family type VI secretion system protein [Sulfurovum sp.]
MLKDITENRPCGEDIKYDDKYIEIETEVEKDFNVANTGETNWETVIIKSEDLLQHQTKDLKLLSYWLYAQKEFNGWDGFLTSFEMYTQLLMQYNKELYPKSEKRKIKILEWLENILEDKLLQSLEKFNKEQLQQLSDILKAFATAIPLTTSTENTFFKETEKKSSDMLFDIKRKEDEKKEMEKMRAEELLKQKEEETLTIEAQRLRRSEEEKIIEKFSTTNTTQTLDENMALSSSDMDNCITTIRNISESLLKKAPADYLSYKLLFSLGEILLEEFFMQQSSTSNDLIPSEDIIKVARNLENNNISIEQLNALIEQLLIRPSWIEGYYIISKMLYKLMRKNDAAKLENMLFTFLYREEDKLNKINMIPDTMQEWLQTKILSLKNDGDNTLEYQHVYQEVLKIKNEQNEQNALLLLEDYYYKAKSEESRFRWKLVLVDFALEVGDKKAALSLLLELEKLIDMYAIHQWQPELAIKTYDTILQPILSQELKVEVKERIYNKLSILDIKKIIELH